MLKVRGQNKPKPKSNSLGSSILRKLCIFLILVLVVTNSSTVSSAENSEWSISGRVVDSSGKGIEGVMVSAIDDERRKWISVFSKKDGNFTVSGLRKVNHHVRTRLLGLADQWSSDVAAGTHDLVIKTRQASGEELELQRPDHRLESDCTSELDPDMATIQ